MQPIELKPDEIHFFYSLVDGITAPALLDQYRNVLSPREIAKTDRYKFEKDRHSCLVTRALLRSVLAASTGQSPERFDFIENRYGKPSLGTDVTGIPLHFNISHTSGITACALTLDREIGIDIEKRDRRIEFDLADRYFAPAEAAHLRSCPPEERRSLFLDYWTLKEAYIKAVGKGLSIELGSFGFDLGPRINIYFTGPASNAAGTRWTFFQFSPVAGYKAAIAIPAPPETALKVYIHQCIPFVEARLQEIL